VDRVAVDTNLWTLMIAGVYHPLYIEKSRRARAYERGQFDALTRVVARFSTLCATPQVLSEVSNLVRQESAHALPGLWRAFRTLLTTVEEIAIPSLGLALDELAPAFGLADMSLSRLADDGCVILTADARLAAYLWGRDQSVGLLGPAGFSGL
jgi:hypothetical protein